MKSNGQEEDKEKEDSRRVPSPIEEALAYR